MYACVLIPRELSLVLTLHPNPMHVLEMSATVWSNTHLPPGTVFYPDEGEVRLDRLENRTVLREDDIRRVYGCYDAIMNISGQEVRHCNWVRFVKTTSEPDGANVISSKVRGQSFYQVTRPIKPNEEIVVLFHLTAERSLYDRMTPSPFASLSPAVGPHMSYSDLHTSLLLRHGTGDNAGMITSTPVSMATQIRDAHTDGLVGKRRSLTFGSSSSSSSFASPVVDTPRMSKNKRNIPQESSFSSPQFTSSSSSRETTVSDDQTGEVTVDISRETGEKHPKDSECSHKVAEKTIKCETDKNEEEKHSSESDENGELKIDDDVGNDNRDNKIEDPIKEHAVSTKDNEADELQVQEETDSNDDTESHKNCVSDDEDDDEKDKRSDTQSPVSMAELCAAPSVTDTDQSQTNAIVTPTVTSACPVSSNRSRSRCRSEEPPEQRDRTPMWPDPAEVDSQSQTEKFGFRSDPRPAGESRVSTLATDGLSQRPMSAVGNKSLTSKIITTFPHAPKSMPPMNPSQNTSLDHPPIKRCRERTWWPCEVCGKKFDRPSLLKRHTRTHTGEKPHACDVCGKAFSTSSSLNTHRRIHSGEKPHQCKICGKRFTASSNLYYHRMTHNKEKPHKCDLCSKSFPTPGDLRSHMYIHNGSWPFRCDVCNRGFSKQTNLKNHMLLHSGDKPHECFRCGKKFALSCNLKTHLKTHDASDSSDSTECHKCGAPLHHPEEFRESLCKRCTVGSHRAFPKSTTPSSLASPRPQQRHTDFSISKLTSSDKKKDDDEKETKIDKPFTLVMPSVTSGKVKARSPPRFMTSSSLTPHQQIHPMYKQFIAAASDQPHWFVPTPAHSLSGPCVPASLKHSTGFLGNALKGSEGQTSPVTLTKLGAPSPAHSVLPAFLTSPEMMSFRGSGVYPPSIPTLPPGFPFPPGSGTWGGHVIAQGF